MLFAAEAEEETSPFVELINHLAPHQYGWAPTWEIAGIDLSITNAVFNMWLAAFLVMAVFWVAASKRKLVPSGIQNFVEVTMDFIKSNIVYSVMKPKDAKAWFPYVAATFLFILFMNLVGLVPWIGFTATSNIWVAGALAVNLYLMAVAIGMAKHGPFTFWRKTVVPPDVPKALLPLMVPIEIISQLARPFSLAVRLFANMLAGHVILYIFVGFIFLAGSSFALAHVAVIPVAMVLETGFTAFEVFVSFIQAVIFAFLATIYINDALHPGH